MHLKQNDNLQDWDDTFSKKMRELAAVDSAHDFLHFQRVVNTAKRLCREHQGDLNIVLPAAWLHDLVSLPKDHPDRSKASYFSAQAAIDYLKSVGYPDSFLDPIFHAIESHSFSANMAPLTLEAKIVQDADRLDALGAIGISRCFAVGGMLNRAIYSGDDPFCEHRIPDDSRYTIDHFYSKLFSIAKTLQTDSGKAEGEKRVQAMKAYLRQLESEIF